MRKRRTLSLSSNFNSFLKFLEVDSKMPEEVRRTNEEKLSQSLTEAERLAEAVRVLQSLSVWIHAPVLPLLF